MFEIEVQGQRQDCVWPTLYSGKADRYISGVTWIRDGKLCAIVNCMFQIEHSDTFNARKMIRYRIMFLLRVVDRKMTQSALAVNNDCSKFRD